jgi:hypothetical protein
MREKSDTTEQLLAGIAGTQHGVVTRAELLRAGLSSAAIHRRVRRGALLTEYPGVYRVGHRAPVVEARYLAAVRACGEGAVLSGRAAAHLLGLLKGAPPPAEVTTRNRRRVEGVRTRRSDVDRRDRTEVRGIPVTTVPRTLVDLAALLSPAELARACHEAGVRYRTTPSQVKTVLARRRGSSRAALLRDVMTGETKVTLSDLERGFLELLRAEGLPLPVTNRVAGGRRVDCRWPEYRLTVELDSYQYHHTRHAWEQDRRREREARARGDEFRRYTYGDVFEDPRFMVRELHELLAPG